MELDGLGEDLLPQSLDGREGRELWWPCHAHRRARSQTPSSVTDCNSLVRSCQPRLKTQHLKSRVQSLHLRERNFALSESYSESSVRASIEDSGAGLSATTFLEWSSFYPNGHVRAFGTVQVDCHRRTACLLTRHSLTTFSYFNSPDIYFLTL